MAVNGRHFCPSYRWKFLCLLQVKLKKYGVEYVRTLSIQDKINTHRQAGENAWQKLRAAGDAKEDVLDNVREAYRAGVIPFQFSYLSCSFLTLQTLTATNVSQQADYLQLYSWRTANTVSWVVRIA